MENEITEIIETTVPLNSDTELVTETETAVNMNTIHEDLFQIYCLGIIFLVLVFVLLAIKFCNKVFYNLLGKGG